MKEFKAFGKWCQQARCEVLGASERDGAVWSGSGAVGLGYKADPEGQTVEWSKVTDFSLVGAAGRACGTLAKTGTP